MEEMSMKPAKIMEIFRSVQGEGKYAGVNQVFVRFFECNMHCSWCDTPASIGDTSRHYQEMDLAAVRGAVESLWSRCHSVSLTGGEPLVQAEFVARLAAALQESGKRTYLETNGVLPDALTKVIEHVDIVAMDMKLPSSTQCRPYWDEHREFLNVARQKKAFIKIVVSSKTTSGDIEQAVDLISQVDDRLELILQPNSFELNNGVMKGCLAYYDYCLQYLPQTRLLPQMHRIMKIR